LCGLSSLLGRNKSKIVDSLEKDHQKEKTFVGEEF